MIIKQEDIVPKADEFKRKKLSIVLYCYTKENEDSDGKVLEELPKMIMGILQEQSDSISFNLGSAANLKKAVAKDRTFWVSIRITTAMDLN